MVKILPSQLCSATAITYKRNRILAHWRRIIDDYWSYVHCAYAEKGYFGASSKKLLRHSFRWPRFPIWKMHFHYRVVFMRYIGYRCATTSCDLDIVSYILRLTCPTHTEILIILGLSVTESWSILHLITFPLTWSMFLKSLTPIYLFTLSLSGHYAEDSAMLSPKIAFLPFCEGYKVHLECTVSCDLCMRDPKYQT